MLEVEITLRPNGRRSGSRVIQRIVIWNEGALAEVSDYGFAISMNERRFTIDDKVPDARYLVDHPDDCDHHGGIAGHRHADGALELLYKVLAYALHEPYHGL
jgi:hypothetical protein